MNYGRVYGNLTESKFLTREQERTMSRGWSELQRAAKDVDLYIMQEGDI